MNDAIIKQHVYEANMQLPKNNLVKLTWGNVSVIDRDKGIICIKPSGVPYSKMRPEDMVITDLDGKPFDNQLKPSSDLATHVYLYQHMDNVQSIAHTHSLHAVAYAQAGRDIPAYGTTHADTFYGPVPCTRSLTEAEVATDYELNTGKVIVETFEQRQINPAAIPAVIVNQHGPFIFGKSLKKAVEHTIILEEVAEMAMKSELLKQDMNEIDRFLLDKHYFRKHGATAYYGQ
ncbi:L-ribulose-5-phosphate 4-epimerase AraD [Staphylococcus pseudintermedius]|nr:L-ribulose-5-phosphate 4-epimerase AraD [Staphylococcus pseudintermedius]MDF0170989.1 L-ribulose-5-phosphate 4-epimerase AraD [Staphylococcus pseudintermedius]MDF0177759.1 L-ribulose-5-phosphate 4-epimerase AraD [Staphylococcus pseudintermedius]MDF0189877.1 L-ribulose-5-phosphate 4-epimerase AraD [Staphylococcus pseudintermedius]MDF0193651.1 L-ribulose-5-phosphate 4-epimerase AraD [Staphylococcus pseudintermedius]